MEADSSLNLVINGGTLEVWSSGDGLDSNGYATITGGDIVVYGPDHRRQRRARRQRHLRGHRRHPVATGSSGMMVAPSTDSAPGLDRHRPQRAPRPPAPRS